MHLNKGTGQSIITICNYDNYNSCIEDWGTARGQQGDTEGTKSNKENIDNKEKIDINNSLCSLLYPHEKNN